MYLAVAKEYLINNDLKSGLMYINLFESEYKATQLNSEFRIGIENCYYEYGLYYKRRKNMKQAQKVVQKGMQYVPNSSVIKSVTESSYNTQPVIIKRKMTNSEYDKYMKTKIIEIK